MSDPNVKLSDLKLIPGLCRELQQLGFETVGDIRRLTTIEILRIPGMGAYLTDALRPRLEGSRIQTTGAEDTLGMPGKI
jgi:hypothetical protein